MMTRLTTLLALCTAFALTACEDPSGKKQDCADDAPRSVSIDEGEDFGENPFEAVFDSGETDEVCDPVIAEQEVDDDVDGSTDDLADGFDDDWSNDDSGEFYDYDEYWY